MRWWCFALLPSIGCAQLAGIDNTTTASSDAAIDARNDAREVDAPDSKPPCTGGDARMTDPMTGACYILFTAAKTRDEARGICAGLGGGALLASVQTGAENQL